MTTRTRYAYDNRDYVCIALIFSLMGGFFWAIRGTTGYGGADGGALAGLGWALLWHLFTRFDGLGGSRPFASGHALAAITLGIAFGGMTGYGVYTAWIGGRFYLDYPEGLRDVAPWTGYAMMFLCGLHWGGIPGAFLAWCAPSKPAGLLTYVLRTLGGVAGVIMASAIVREMPEWFLPFYDEGLYQNPENATCVRAQNSIENIAPHVGLFLGFLAVEMLRRDKRAVAVMLLMGLGFALPFTIGGWWHTWHTSGIAMPWWKFWEMSIGLGGGLAIGLAFILFNRPAEQENPVSETGAPWAWPVIALATVIVFFSMFDGVANNFEIEMPDVVETLTIVVGLVGLVGGLAYGLLRPGSLPLLLVPVLLGLIVVAGLAVSFPAAWGKNNYVLWTCYILYLAGSGSAFYGLCKNQA